MIAALTYMVYALLLSFGIPLAMLDAQITSTLPPAVVAGVPAVFAIPLLIEGLKAGGLSSRFAPLAAMVLGFVWQLAAALPLSFPSFFLALAAGPLTGLAAVGGYSAIKAATDNDAGHIPPPLAPPSPAPSPPPGGQNTV